MRKKLVVASVLMLFAMSLTGCKSTDYNEAKTAIDEQDYETAFELLVNLGDYKDSQELLVDNINTYVSSLADKENYDKALNILDSYSSVSDFSDLYNEIQEEKDLYDLYSKAENLLLDNKISEGFEILETLPNDYKNIEEIYSSYNSLKDTVFKGTHRNGVSGESTQKIVFSVEYDSLYEKFKLHVYKAVYWSDGSIYNEHNFYLDADDIDDNTIKYGSYTWTINNGRLTEVEKGQTYTYN